MVELLFQRTGDQVVVRCGEYTTTVPLVSLAPTASTWQAIYDNAPVYGKNLCEAAFPDECMRSLLASLPREERLVLVAEDPLLASVPWEYLRDQQGKLLAARCSLVRGLPEQQRRDPPSLNPSLEILALPVSPLDEARVLNVEGEWSHLVQTVNSLSPHQALTLRRVRPPTRAQLEQAQRRAVTTIVHFMGHGARREDTVFLAFEDARARVQLIDAADFADSLEAQVFLVLLNSCFSALTTLTEFGNLAHFLVQRGVPYALGMQCTIPDEAALVLSKTLYGFLLQGQSLETALIRTRRVLAEPGRLSQPDWLAGIPALYTSLREPAAPLELLAGEPTIQPDPQQLQRTCDLSALPQARHFLGRSQETSEALAALLAPGASGFVLLHGLGGIGKTSLARALAERVNWYYEDRVLAYSFETFAHLEQQQRVIDETFAERFYARLARFYGRDPADYATTTDIQQALLQERTQKRSLLILDNIETLFDALGQAHPAAQALAAFLSRLREGQGVILLTSRQLPPADWGECSSIWLSGLSPEAGALLFAELLPQKRRRLASEAARRALSERVQGHPLSIRLLAAHFADKHAATLDAFLEDIEAELEAAEQSIPTSLEDPERQRTLYACLGYSIKRLTAEQEQVLRTLSLFQMPFPPEFATALLAPEDTAIHVQTLRRLSLLEVSAHSRIGEHAFLQGELILLELHPMVRWYIQHHLSQPETLRQESYGHLFVSLLAQSYEEYDTNERLRTLVRLTLPDGEVALRYLSPTERSRLAYYLAHLYQWLGQNRRSLALYEQALELYQLAGDVRGIAVTQGAMADVLVHLGQPQQALSLYELSLHTTEQLGDVHGIAVTQGAMADVLVHLGQPQQALSLYELSLHTKEQLGDLREIAVTQHAMADVLVHLGQPQQALSLYELSLHSFEQLGDVRGIAVTQGAMADVLVHLGQPQQALSLYELSLHTKEQLGNLREIAVTQANLCQLLISLGETQRALLLAWEAYTSLSTHGYEHDSEHLQHLLLSIKWESLGASTFDEIWEKTLPDSQPDWLLQARPQTPRSDFSPTVIQAVRDFVNADDWQATQSVVQKQQSVL
ncbi:MAG TPA: tetratricopeptide repeat protein, partial [Ktedonobacteraceae bacterium]